MRPTNFGTPLGTTFCRTLLVLSAISWPWGLAAGLRNAAAANPTAGTAAPAARAAATPTPATRPAAGRADAPGGTAERVEKDDDGTTRRYRVDSQGRKDGPYEELFKNGKPRVRGSYAAGVKSGPWTTYDQVGKLQESVAYVKGVAEGPYTWNVPGGKAGVRGTYRQGGFLGPVTITNAGGQIARQANYPRALTEIQKTWATLYPKRITPPKFIQEPILTPPYQAGEMAAESLEEALKVAKLYRYLSGLPWQQLTLDRDGTKKAQHGAVLLQKLGFLTHDPTRPSDMDEAFFKLAFDGCHESNIHSGHNNMIGAVRGFMDDSDASNIDRVGHRRWIMRPGLRKVGFGYANTFTTMHVNDHGKDVPLTSFVAFPGEGYYPRELVEPYYAWSAHFPTSRVQVPESGAIKVRVTRLDEHFQPMSEAEPRETRVVSVIPDKYEGWAVLVFKPDAQAERTWSPKTKLMDAGKYSVEISGLKTLKGAPQPYSYLVDLVDMPGETPDIPEPVEPTDPKKNRTGA